MKVELLCSCEKEELEKRIQKVAAAGKLSRMPGTVFDAYTSMSDYEKALKFIKMVIVLLFLILLKLFHHYYFLTHVI